MDSSSDKKGVKISVMGRHILNDGKTPGLRITNQSYDKHLPILAPPLKLIGSYYNRGLKWEEFEEGYLAHLGSQEASEIVKNLAKRAIKEDIAIMCIEETTEKGHRRLLTEECKRIFPQMEVIIK